MDTWRLILHGECDPFWNMAADCAILEAVALQESPPTVRLYRWTRPAVTVGRFQNIDRTIRVDSCRRDGVPIVRRPTGGRGILHGGDQTISVTAPETALGLNGAGVASCYQKLSIGILDGLRKLGLSVRMSVCEPADGAGDCFAVRSLADVIQTENGVKLVGSAQRRKDGAILQQSSIRYRDPGVCPSDVFLGTIARTTYPLQEFSASELESAIRAGFEQALGVRLYEGQLSSFESSAAGEAARQFQEADTGLALVDTLRGI